MIGTHPSSRIRHLLVSMFPLTAIPTAWAFAQTAFARGMRRRAVSLLWLLLCVAGPSAVPAFAQGIITTVAGNGERGFWGNGMQATSAPLNLGSYTGGVVVDQAGNLYIADTGSHRIYKVSPGGQRLTVAGSDCVACADGEFTLPQAGFSGDGGPAFDALLNSPTGLGVDAAGNLYIVDTGNQRIRKVSTNGIITTVAGNGVRGFSGDGGIATAASLSLGNVQLLGIAGYPTSVAVDGAGNLYIPDTDNGRVRKVTPSGIITTVVAGLRDPYGVSVDAAGNLFITDSSNDQILKVSASGAVATIIEALHSPSGVAVDGVGNLYIADSHTHRIRKFEPNGVTKIIAGSGDPIFDPIEGFIFVGGFSGDGGPATSALLNFPWGVVVDATGNVYIADSVNNRIRKVTAASTDDQRFFVRQHYLDFLSREPDADGFAFWTNEIVSCGSDTQCIEVKRINVSAAFFLSIEFHQTGYLVYRIYKASYGNLPDAPVPIKLSEFLPDTQAIGQGVIVNQSGWEQVLENNRQAFAAEFVQRSRFTSTYPASMPPDAFVDALFANAGVVPAGNDRAAAIGEFGSATTTADAAARARALRSVSENSTLAQQEFNRAFVLMQYFGYLRRNPNDPPELTLDFQGYNFWLNKLNQFNGNFVDSEMVKAFITSGEYRQRFGQP